MTRYAAFLRGINLGANRRIAMPQLRSLAEGLGYGDVRTYINSGNLLFTSDGSARDLTREIQSALEAEFGATIDVAVRSEPQLRKILLANPYPDGNPSQVTVAFLTRPAPESAQEKVAALATAAEPFTFAGDEIWVNYTDGIADSKLAAQFIKAIGVSATTRNVRTVGKVASLLG
jgi:uncharacterized protein (DUF1697 family)